MERAEAERRAGYAMIETLVYTMLTPQAFILVWIHAFKRLNDNYHLNV